MRATGLGYNNGSGSYTDQNAYKARFAPSWARFDKYKSSLLNQLRAAQARKKKLKPKDFDGEKAWLDLRKVARLFFAFEGWTDATASRSDEAARLSELSSLLANLGVLMKRAMRDDIGALFEAWRTIEDMTFASTPNFLKEMAKFERNIAELTAIVDRAEKNKRPTEGRPSGPSKLPSAELIIGLAQVYRKHTGRPAGAGQGPFADFAHKCLIALGRSDTNKGSLVNLIKRARLCALSSPYMGNTPAPFRD